jgi:arylsulfatase A-like enzyme
MIVCSVQRVARSLLLISVIALPGCQPEPPRGILLINIDTLRADHLGAYGYAHNTSPNLDAFAEESVLFRNAMAPAPWTLPSVATLFTSLYPTVHGALHLSKSAMTSHQPDYTPTAKLADALTTLPEILRDNGFATAAFVRGAYPTSIYGFKQGFDRFEENQAYGVRFGAEQALAWLDERKPDSFFIYLHTIEVHSPYQPMPPTQRQLKQLGPDERARVLKAAKEEQALYLDHDRAPSYRGDVSGSIENIQNLAEAKMEVSRSSKKRLVELYDRGIGYTDRWLGLLLTSLRERGLLDETIVIVTSDHGEEFWDHGGLDHGHSYYDELLRVPLMMRIPGEGRKVIVDQVVGLIDVLPTLLDLVGIPVLPVAQGRSLRPLWTEGELPARPYFAESNHETAGLAMRTERWKLIRSRNAPMQLYDLWDDPNERHNVCKKERETCQQLVGELQAWRSDTLLKRDLIQPAGAPAAEPDAATVERLRALGYVD